MEIENAMRIWTRICDIPKPGSECPLHRKCSMRYVSTHIEEIVSILTKWAAEHPERTRMDDFFEKHPKAQKNKADFPIVCAAHCGYIDECPNDYSLHGCEKCWRQPLEEVEK